MFSSLFLLSPCPFIHSFNDSFLQSFIHSSHPFILSSPTRGNKNPDFPGLPLDASLLGRTLKLVVYDTEDPNHLRETEILGEAVFPLDWEAGGGGGGGGKEFPLTQHPVTGEDTKTAQHLQEQLLKHRSVILVDFKRLEHIPDPPNTAAAAADGHPRFAEAEEKKQSDNTKASADDDNDGDGLRTPIHPDIPNSIAESLREFLTVFQDFQEAFTQQESQIQDLQTSQTKVIEIGQVMQEELMKEIQELQQELATLR